jgi:hypothetical protein
MTKQYTNYTVAVSPEELDKFEKKLQRIKDYFGIDSTSTVIQKIIDTWAELQWKAQKYDQLKDTFLGFEAYYKYEKGEFTDAHDGRIH